MLTTLNARCGQHVIYSQLRVIIQIGQTEDAVPKAGVGRHLVEDFVGIDDIDVLEKGLVSVDVVAGIFTRSDVSRGPVQDVVPGSGLKTVGYVHHREQHDELIRPKVVEIART